MYNGRICVYSYNSKRGADLEMVRPIGRTAGHTDVHAEFYLIFDEPGSWVRIDESQSTLSEDRFAFYNPICMEGNGVEEVFWAEASRAIDDGGTFDMFQISGIKVSPNEFRQRENARMKNAICINCVELAWGDRYIVGEIEDYLSTQT